MADETSLPTPAHQTLLEQALQGLRGDERVLAILLGGSLATGEGDEESDIDLTVVVDDDMADQFTREWALWLRRFGPPVLAGPGPMPNLVTFLMRNGLRLDVSVERRSTIGTRPRRAAIVLHDPLDLLSSVDVVVPRFEPTPEWLGQNVENFLRFLDQLSVLVVRKEWIAGIDNAWYLISQLVDLYAHRNRAPRTSARRVNARMTAEQRSAIESLPVIQATERAIVDVHLAVARLFLPEAQELCRQLGMAWPQVLEQTVTEHLRGRIGIDL